MILTHVWDIPGWQRRLSLPALITALSLGLLSLPPLSFCPSAWPAWDTALSDPVSVDAGRITVLGHNGGVGRNPGHGARGAEDTGGSEPNA